MKCINVSIMYSNHINESKLNQIFARDFSPIQISRKHFYEPQSSENQTPGNEEQRPLSDSKLSSQIANCTSSFYTSTLVYEVL